MSLHFILSVIALVLPAISALLQAQAPLFSPSETVENHGPSIDSARANAPKIFNAIHSSMRQWGSSLHHNGMSFFPARIPNNTHLYHGTHTPDAVNGMEWLAFEIEHAEMFSRTYRPPRRRPEEPGRPGRPGEPREPGDGGAPPPIELHWAEPSDLMRREDDDEPWERSKGYLHVYRTTRPLTNLLYVDGLSAGKTIMGTLDTQDLILRNNSDGCDQPVYNDFTRGQELCDLGAEWGIEGFVRMEMGFEIIFCEFSDGLVLESARQRPVAENYTYERLNSFEIMRGASLRYSGITAQRLRLDYSGMVSAFWYDLNLTNPDQERADVPRLPASETETFAQIKSDLKHAFEESIARKDVGNDWQGIADMIVSRYSDRLRLLAANDTTKDTILTEIAVLLNLYVDFGNFDVPTAIEKCSEHFLTAAILQTASDHIIHDALETVTNQICTTLFYVEQVLLEDEASTDSSALNESKSALMALCDYLDWTTWKQCGKCAHDEVCFVAIWPWGSPEDHKHPSCVKDEPFSSRPGGYWEFRRRP